MKNVRELYGLRNLINQPTCFKNLQNPSFIDSLLTNKPQSFCNTCLVETGVSDFHKTTPNDTFHNKKNLQSVNQKLSRIGTSQIFLEGFLSNMKNCNNDFNSFTHMAKEVVNLHAPQKKR